MSSKRSLTTDQKVVMMWFLLFVLVANLFVFRGVLFSSHSKHVPSAAQGEDGASN